MRAHHSNFKLVGFVSEPDLPELVAAAHAANVPLLDDLGSGTLLDTERFGLRHEPTVQESVCAGVDLVWAALGLMFLVRRRRTRLQTATVRFL